MRQKSLLLRTLGESPKLKIIDFFMDNPIMDFTKKDTIDALGMSKQAFYKYFNDLEEYGIVAVSRKIGKTSLYKINQKHPLVMMLRDYEKNLSLQIADQEEMKTKSPITAK